MRIEWQEDNARAVEISLRHMQQEMELCLCRVQKIEAAMQDADPDGTSKRMEAIGAKLEACVQKLRRMTEEVSELDAATNHMIRSFENCESDVIRMLNSLDTGQETHDRSVRRAMSFGVVRRVDPRITTILKAPRPRIAPMTRFSSMGLITGWLLRLLDRM